jgi:hypothetical protein
MRTLFAITLSVATVAAASAEVVNVIYQHNSELTQGVHYQILPAEQTIRIMLGVPGQVFEFEAVLEENGQYVEPGNIDLVTADENAGRVDLTFVGHNGHPYGAADIKEIRLNQPGVAGVIRELHIANNLGDLGPIRAGGVGTMTIGGNVLNDIYVPGTIAGPVTIGGACIA